MSAMTGLVDARFWVSLIPGLCLTVWAALRANRNERGGAMMLWRWNLRHRRGYRICRVCGDWFFPFEPHEAKTHVCFDCARAPRTWD